MKFIDPLIIVGWKDHVHLQTFSQYFKLQYENKFWAEVVKNIKYGLNNGYNIHILGYGIRSIYSCIAYMIGDDPALHRALGFYEGNAKLCCMTCLFPSRCKDIYNPQVHVKRNIVEIQDMVSNAASCISDKLSNKRKLSRIENEYLKKCKLNCIQPVVNPFHDAPMGWKMISLIQYPIHFMYIVQGYLKNYVCILLLVQG